MCLCDCCGLASGRAVSVCGVFRHSRVGSISTNQPEASDGNQAGLDCSVTKNLGSSSFGSRFARLLIFVVAAIAGSWALPLGGASAQGIDVEEGQSETGSAGSDSQREHRLSDEIAMLKRVIPGWAMVVPLKVLVSTISAPAAK